MKSRFDVSLLYAECARCHKPVLLRDTGETLLWMGIPPDVLDADCLLLYDGCPNCAPGKPAYKSRFVRLGVRAKAVRAH